MIRHWRSIPLGSILRKSDRWVTIDLETNYQEVTVRMKGKGVIARGFRMGSEMAGDRRLEVHTGQFIISRIDARHGASGIIPVELDGAVVTNDFPVFDCDDTQINASFLNWLSKTEGFVEACRAASEGSTNRVRLKEDLFTRIQVNIPPIDEQARIVTIIEAVATRLDSARQLRQEVQDDSKALLVAMAHRNDLSPAEKMARGSQHVALSEFLLQSGDDVAVTPGQTYPHFGIYSFGKGLFRKGPLSADEIKASRLYRVAQGQFIYGRLNAYEGAFGFVTKEFDGSHVSSEFPIFDCDQTRVLPEFLLAYFSAPSVWEALKRQVTGIGGGAVNRRIRLKESVFLAHRLWLPRLDYQQRIKSVASKLNEAKALRARTEAQFDALLPAILDKAFKGEL